MKKLLNQILDDIYSSKLYEKFALFQNKNVGTWQTNLLKNPLYAKWHGTRYYNTVHWGLLAGIVIGLIVGIMLPISAPKQIGYGQEFELEPPSSTSSHIIITPNLLSINGENAAEIEIYLADENYNPLSGRRFSIIASGEDIDVFQNQESTGATGFGYATISSNTVGVKEIMVQDDETGYVLEKKAYVEFTKSSVLHWRKPGNIDEEAAATVSIPTENAYKKWSPSKVSSEAILQNLLTKKSSTNDSCTIYKENIYCSGGLNDQDEKLKDFYQINFETNEVTEFEELPKSLTNHEIIESEGSLYVLGGRNNNEVTSSVYKYSLENKTWEQDVSMTAARENFAIVKIGEIIYAIGGYDGSNQLTTVERFYNGTWEKLTGMGDYRNFHAGAVWSGRIYIFGGWNGKNVLNSGEVYDSTQNKWFKTTDMPTARWAHSVVMFNNKIYIIGGYDKDNKLVETIDIFNPQTNSWTTSNIKITNSEFSIAETKDSILLIGGNNNSNHILSYTPEKYSLTVTLNNNIRRSGFPSTQINVNEDFDGKEIVVRELENLDLSKTINLKLQIYSSIVNPDVSFGFGENSVEENIFPITIDSKESWKEISVDISEIEEEKINEIKYLGIIINSFQEPFSLNLYDIWTENEFYSSCPCEKEISNIFFSKDDSQSLGKLSISSLNGQTSTIDLFVRSANTVDDLSLADWQELTPPYSIGEINNNFLEFKTILKDEEKNTLPDLRSISVEIK